MAIAVACASIRADLARHVVQLLALATQLDLLP